jgi:hypothetical protein
MTPYVREVTEEEKEENPNPKACMLMKHRKQP